MRDALRKHRTPTSILLVGLMAPMLAVGAPANGVAAAGEPRAPAASGSWPSFRFDLSNSGYNRYETTLSPSNVSGLVEKWSLTRYHVTDVSDVVADGFV